MEITEFCISGFTAHVRAVRSLHVWYLWRMPEMDAPRALVFRPLVKGNEALGTRLGLHVLLGRLAVFHLVVVNQQPQMRSKKTTNTKQVCRQ